MKRMTLEEIKAHHSVIPEVVDAVVKHGGMFDNFIPSAEGVHIMPDVDTPESQRVMKNMDKMLKRYGIEVDVPS